MLAALDPGQQHHAESRKALAAARPPRLLTPFVLAELDYLITKYVGASAARLFLDEVARGAYTLVEFDNAALAQCLQLLDSQPGLDLGIADASVWWAAHRFGTPDILTLDEQHFRRLPGSGGRPLLLLPPDA